MEGNLISVGNSALVCLYCNEPFSTKEELGLHIVDNHHVPKPYRCKECNKDHATKGALTKHFATHVRNNLIEDEVNCVDDDKYPCYICDYTCNTKRQFNSHILAHSLKNSFFCKKCDFRTISKSFFSSHREICDQIKPYKCRDCPMTFRFANALKTHSTLVHKNNTPFQCSSCTSYFTTKPNLKKHVKICT